jgi:hypothetical protein
MDRNAPPVFEFDGKRTLPLYVVRAQAPEGGIPAMGSAKCQIVHLDPRYQEPSYNLDEHFVKRIGSSSDEAMRVVKRWKKHASNLHYYLQFQDDDGSKKTINLQHHTELISAFCDSKLGVDTTPLWELVQWTVSFKELHSEYRHDANQLAVWDTYADKLAETWDPMSKLSIKCDILINRIVNLLRLREFESVHDAKPPTTEATNSQSEVDAINVFFAYSHKDEALRDQLDNHLASLKRQACIVGWHDRRIEGGKNWDREIHEHLEKSQIILLLVSSDFIASDYCSNVEVKRALELNENGVARVIPVILRPCDWSETALGRLQGIPKDAMAVTSWKNQDEAFTQIAKEIRTVVKYFRGAGPGR